jgi:hypothetical protein
MGEDTRRLGVQLHHVASERAEKPRDSDGARTVDCVDDDAELLRSDSGAVDKREAPDLRDVEADGAVVRGVNWRRGSEQRVAIRLIEEGPVPLDEPQAAPHLRIVGRGDDDAAGFAFLDKQLDRRCGDNAEVDDVDPRSSECAKRTVLDPCDRRPRVLAKDDLPARRFRQLQVREGGDEAGHNFGCERVTNNSADARNRHHQRAGGPGSHGHDCIQKNKPFRYCSYFNCGGRGGLKKRKREVTA